MMRLEVGSLSFWVPVYLQGRTVQLLVFAAMFSYPMGNLPNNLPPTFKEEPICQAPPPTGPKKPDIQPGPGRGQVAGAHGEMDFFFGTCMKLTVSIFYLKHWILWDSLGFPQWIYRIYLGFMG